MNFTGPDVDTRTEGERVEDREREEDSQLAEDYDPSPMCNCGTCSAGNYTCIRDD